MERHPKAGCFPSSNSMPISCKRFCSLRKSSKAIAKANAIVSDTEVIPHVGSFIINGRSGVNLNSKISSNLVNLKISSSHNLISYTQRISLDEGDVTVLNYGRPPFDITKKISDLEARVYEDG